jgi:phosphotransferase system enzyme I (PtsI)
MKISTKHQVPGSSVPSENDINKRLTGIGVSGGIAIGQAVVLERYTDEVFPRRMISPLEVPSEIGRFELAVKKAAEDLKKIKKMVDRGSRLGDHSYILEAHLLLLEDRMFYQGTEDTIRNELLNAEWALSEIVDKITSDFEAIEDPYLKERARDIYFVGQRVIRILMGMSDDKRIRRLPPNAVIVAHDFSPADTAQIHALDALGFATDMGGRTSHTAIMARSLKIPAITGLDHITEQVQTGDTIIIDGSTGLVVINPDAEMIVRFRERQEIFRKYHEALLAFGSLPAVTADGARTVRIMANVELVEEIDIAREHGSEGIGLFRTEYLFLGRPDLPSEEEQYHVYRNVLERNGSYPVTIRTLDVGADKISANIPIDVQSNPAMGLRAIRFCLKNPAIFKTQLRAILRAAAHGSCRLLIPMISCFTELQATRHILSEVKSDLAHEGLEHNNDVRLGVLLEVPSAVAIVDLLAREADFLSIGTNDLIQYAFAIDRLNEHVNYLYDTLHPAVLRLLENIVSAAQARGISVAMCGEMAGDPVNVPILLGLGLEELSMNALSIPMVKKLIRSVTMDQCRELTYQAMQMQDAGEIRLFLESWIRERFPEDFFLDESRQANESGK